MKNNIFSPKLLHRVRIRKQLELIFQVPMIIMLASAGYGKTTAAKSFLRNRKGIEFIWFSLGTDENDTDWMWKKLCYTISQLNPEFANRLSEYGLPKNSKEVDYIVINVRNVAKKPIVFVIDDYHENRSNEFNQLLTAFAKAAIPNFHILVISRVAPELPFNELEIKGLCKILYQKEFGFSLQEIGDLFELNGFPLTEEEQNLLYSNTEGWTSAVYLELLKYSETRNVDRNINISIIGLMKTEVYDKLDMETQRILLKLSVFDSFNLEAAIYVTENRKAGEFIRKLLADNCFLRFDSKNKVYTIHAILRELLQELFHSSNIDKNALFSKYGEWCAENGKFIGAIEMYNRAKNYIRILDLHEIHGATEFIDAAPKTVVEAFEAMDLNLKLSRPIAYLTFIFSYLIIVDGQKGAELLMEAKAVYETDETLMDKKQILAEISIIESFLYFNKNKLMREYQKKACELFEGKKSRILCSEMMYSFGSPHILYIYHRECGQFKALTESMSDSKRYYEYISHGNGTGSRYIVRAEYYLETGDLTNAEFYAHKGIFKAKTKDQTCLIICGKLCLARVALLKGKSSMAFSIIDKLKEEVLALKNPYLNNSMEIAYTIIYGSMGMLLKIPDWLRTDDISKCRKIYIQRMGMACIAAGKAAMLRKSYIELEVIVETIYEVCAPHNNILGFIYAGIYGAISKYHLYGMEKAIEEFKAAVKLAKIDEIVTPFVESILELTPLFKMLQKETYDEWVQKVIHLGSQFTKAYMQVQKRDEDITLTNRETKVLSLVEYGYKQYEIAQELGISPNTVRRHLQNIYAKLGVSNKTLALKKIAINKSKQSRKHQIVDYIQRYEKDKKVTKDKSEKSSEKILALIRRNNKITIGELAERIGISTRAVEKQISRLKEKNLIVRVGSNKGGYWQLIEL